MTHKMLASAFGLLGLLGIGAALQTAPTFDLEVREAEFDLDPDFVAKGRAALDRAAREWDRIRQRNVWLEPPVPDGTGGSPGRLWLTAATPSTPDVIRFGSPYSEHESNPARTDIIALLLDDRFSTDERARILEAAQEWNYVLNGYLRFEVGVTSPAANSGIEPDAWVVARATGGANAARQGSRDVVLAVAQRLPVRSGMLLVFIDRFNRISLRRVMLHEFGHVLGLDHDDRSRLMSARYFRDRQKCVDKVTVELLAAVRGLPVHELNWCQSPAW
jgi:hypothetical protein